VGDCLYWRKCRVYPYCTKPGMYGSRLQCMDDDEYESKLHLAIMSDPVNLHQAAVVNSPTKLER